MMFQQCFCMRRYLLLFLIMFFVFVTTDEASAVRQGRLEDNQECNNGNICLVFDQFPRSGTTEAYTVTERTEVRVAIDSMGNTQDGYWVPIGFLLIERNPNPTPNNPNAFIRRAINETFSFNVSFTARAGAVANQDYFVRGAVTSRNIRFPAGSSRVQLNDLFIIDDSDAEDDDEIRLTITRIIPQGFPSDPIIDVPNRIVDIIIARNDNGIVRFRLCDDDDDDEECDDRGIYGSPLTLTEGDTLRVEVQLSRIRPIKDVQVRLSMSFENIRTPLSNRDYTTSDSTILFFRFEGSETTQTLIFEITDDNIVEPPEGVVFNLSLVGDFDIGVDLHNDTALLTIEDNDQAVLGFDSETYEILENEDNQLEVVLRLTQNLSPDFLIGPGSGIGIGVTLQFVGETAGIRGANADLQVMRDGTQSSPFNVGRVREDTNRLRNPDSSGNVNLTPFTINAEAIVAARTITFSFDENLVEIDETFTIRIISCSLRILNIPIANTELRPLLILARAQSDMSDMPRSNSCAGSGQFDVREPDNVSVYRSTTITILNDDETTISFTAPSSNEIEEGSSIVQMINLTNPVAYEMTVRINAADDEDEETQDANLPSASEDRPDSTTVSTADYVFVDQNDNPLADGNGVPLTTLSVIFPSNTTEQAVRIITIDDQLTETTEFFLLTIGNRSTLILVSNTGIPDTALLSVRNDITIDPPMSFSITDTDTTTIEFSADSFMIREGDSSVEVQVRFSGEVDEYVDLMVNLSIGDDSNVRTVNATAEVDYNVVLESETQPNPETGESETLEETLNVNVTDNEYQGEFRLTGNTPIRTLTISVVDEVGNEEDPTILEDDEVFLMVLSLANSERFRLRSVFPRDAISSRITLNADLDSVIATITDNDQTDVIVSFLQDGSNILDRDSSDGILRGRVDESDARAPIRISVTLSNQITRELIVEVSTTSEDTTTSSSSGITPATPREDYELIERPPQSLIFQPNTQDPISLEIDIENDELVEGNEEFQLILSVQVIDPFRLTSPLRRNIRVISSIRSESAAETETLLETIETPSIIIPIIIDDDETALVNFCFIGTLEQGTETGNRLFMNNCVSTRDGIYRVSEGTARIQVRVFLADTRLMGTSDSVTITPIVMDGIPSTQEEPRVTEGAAFETFDFTRDVQQNPNIVLSSERSFDTLGLNIDDDNILELDEHFTVQLETPNATFVDNRVMATVIIIDNDEVTVSLSVANSLMEVTNTLMEMERIENQDPVSLNITIAVPENSVVTLAPDVTIMVQLAVTDVTTIAPQDYEYSETDNLVDNLLTVTLSGIDGIRPTPTPSHSATIIAIDDNFVEPYETFDIMLMPISDNVDVMLSDTEVECSTTVPGNAVCTQVTIIDDDRATVSLMVPNSEVTEGDAPINVAVLIEESFLSSGVTLNINLAVQALTATANQDYRVGTNRLTEAGTEETCSANDNDQTLTFTSVVLEQIVPICIISDSLVEDPESFQITMSITPEEQERLDDIQLIDGSTPPQSLFRLEVVNSITVSISNNNQVRIGFDLLTYTVNENENFVDITIRLIGTLAMNTRVNVRLNTQEASADNDVSTNNPCRFNHMSQLSATDEEDYTGHREGGSVREGDSVISISETTLLLTLTEINSSATIQIPIINDQLVERPEIFCVILERDETAGDEMEGSDRPRPTVIIDRPRTTVIITDDDQATVTLTTNANMVSEGGSIIVTVAIDGADPNEPVLADGVEVMVGLRIGNQGDTATAEDDYTVVDPPTARTPEGIYEIEVTLTARMSRQPVTINIVNEESATEEIIEGDESFDVEIELTRTEQNRLQTFLGRVNIITVTSSTVTVIITDDDDTRVSFGTITQVRTATANLENGCEEIEEIEEEEAIAVQEGQEECRFSVPLSITGRLASPQTVLINTRISADQRERATRDVDYSLLDNNAPASGMIELTFSPIIRTVTVNTVTVNIAIRPDTLLEEDESFELILLMSDAENGLQLEDTVTENDPLNLIFASVTVVIRERADNMIIWNIEERSLTDSASDSVNNANIGNNVINIRENAILRYIISYTGLELQPNQIFSIEVVLEAEETTPADFSQTLSQSLRTAAEQIDGVDITEESASGNSARVTFTIPEPDDPTIQVVIPTSLEFSLSIAADNQLERQESFSILIRNAQVMVDNILDPTVNSMILVNNVQVLISQDSSSLLEEVMKLTTPVLLRTAVPTMATAITRQVNQVLLNRITQLPEVSPQGFNINFASLVGGSEPQTGRPLPLEQRLRWKTWANGTFNNVNSEQDVAVEGTVINVWTGTDYLIDQNILVGVLVGYENSNLEVNEIEQSAVEGQGYAGGIYMGAQVLPGVIMDVSFAWMSISYDTEVFDTRLQAQVDEPIGNVSASFDAQRIMFAGNLTGTWHWNALRISPQLGVIWANEAQDAYQDSNNVTVEKQDFNFGRIVFGPELGIRMNMTANSWIEPFGAATGQYAFMTDIPQATILSEENGADTEQEVRALDPDGQLELQARGGLMGGIGRSFTYRLEGAYDGLLDQSGYTAWSGSATLGYRWKDFLQLSFTNDYTGQDAWSSSTVVTYQWHDFLELSVANTYGIAYAWSGSTDMRYQMREDLALRVSSQYNLKTLTPVNIYIDWTF